MKKVCLLSICLCAMSFAWSQLPMGGWQMHNAYGNVSAVENGREKVYALSNGALMSVDKEDGLIEYYNKLTGLSSSNIVKIKYDNQYGRLVIVYADGYVDLLYENGDVVSIIDLYTSQTSENKLANDVLLHERTMYMAMSFGILEFDLQRRELKGTYYIGDEAGVENVKYMTVTSDSLYAMTDDKIFSIALSKNKQDYHNWTTASLPGVGEVQGLHSINDTLYILQTNKLYVRHTSDSWTPFISDISFSHICQISDRLAVIAADGLYVVTSDSTIERFGEYRGITDATFDNFSKTYWYALGSDGVGSRNITTNSFSKYIPNGPIVNNPYRLRITGNRLYVVPGGYWASKNDTHPTAMYYENGEWTNYGVYYFIDMLGKYSSDYSDMLGDPKDPSHFFIAAFSVGLLEFRNNEFYMLHNSENAPFVVSGTGTEPDIYTWIDALCFDEAGNLFVGSKESGLCVLSPSGTWTVLRNAATYPAAVRLNRVKNVLISNKNSNIKVIINNRSGDMPAGVGVMDDNGTLTNQTDDRAIFRHDFKDQFDKEVLPTAIFTAEQDLNGELWVGTNAGLFIIPDLEQMFTSNACNRVLIMRTDGSNLGDYLLASEEINAIAVDGANRKWIGTQGSGLYLVSADGKETIEHFTTDNSPLLDNTIMSLAINHKTGEVFIGTGAGLMSYQSDAAEAEPEIPNENIYVYPNPVLPDFEGVITIAGLTENTVVKITDSAGMLVAETESLGGIATWDGKNSQGKRVRTGVYFAQCATKDGKQHALVKILVID